MHVLILPGPDPLPEGLAAELSDGWTCTVARDVDSAMALADTAGYDAVVCSSRFAAEEPSRVLVDLRDRHPGALRLIASPVPLAGRDSPVAAMEDVAQQTVAEPLSGRELRATLRRLMTTRSLLGDPVLRRLLGQVDRLPSPPTTYLALRRACGDPDVHLDDVADIVGRDPGLAVRTLRIANSVIYSRGVPIRNLRAAVGRIGLHSLGQVVLASEVFASDGSDRQHEQTSLLASRLAFTIAPADVPAEAAATAALLAGIGELLPGHIIGQLDTQRPDWRGLPRTDLFAACLLAMWGLPMELVEAVAYRARPARVERAGFGLVGCVHVACALAANQTPDLEQLEALGVQSRLEGWQRLAASYRRSAAEDAA